MRKIQQICLEQIGGDLCLVFKTDESRFRGILGKIEPCKLAEFAKAAELAAKSYATAGHEHFTATLVE